MKGDSVGQNRLALPDPEANGKYGDLERAYGSYVLIGILWFFVIHRIFLMVSTDFPINDGGLFLVFIKSVAETFPALPVNVSYNNLPIPFAYPPLAFWIGAFLTKLGIDPLTVTHQLPIVMNVIYVLLFALALIKSGMEKLTVALVMLCFFADTRSFDWLVMGGGLSRGFGSVFFLATILAIGLPLKTGPSGITTKRAIFAGLCVGATILSHLEWGIDATVIATVLLAMTAPSISAFARSLVIVGLLAFATIFPWLLYVLNAHGFEPLIAAAGTSQRDWRTYSGDLLGILSSILLDPFILLGFYFCIKKKYWFWISSIFIFIFITPRHGLTPAALPLAIFGAVGLINSAKLFAKNFDVRVFWAWSIPIVLLGIWNPAYLGMGTLREYERRSMTWVAEHHPNETFIVLTRHRWQSDASAEWFPVLAKAQSLNTVQGREWLSNGSFSRARADDQAIKSSKTCHQLLSNLQPFNSAHFIWAEWATSCFSKTDFKRIHSDGKVTIFERLWANPAPGEPAPTMPGYAP